MNIGKTILQYVKDKEGIVDVVDLYHFINHQYDLEMSFYELGVIVSDLERRTFCELIPEKIDGRQMYNNLKITEAGLVYLKFEF